MDNFIFDLILLVLASGLGLIQMIILWVLRSITTNAKERAIENKEHRDLLHQQSLTLVRIDARLDAIDDLKKDREHDHKAIRELDKRVDEHKVRLDAHDRVIDSLDERCKLFHLKGKSE